MDIATVQKRKFLNNIYKLLYARGEKPSEQEVRKAFAEYFSANKPGLPVRIDYNRLSATDLTDVDVLNELMVGNLFNLEVLYDAVFENNQQIMSTVTALNNKLEGLQARRKDLEAKVDQLLFANSNTDGYFYSAIDKYSSLEYVDMNLTTAFVDTVNGNVTIPKITNEVSDSLVVKEIFTGSATMSAIINGTTLVSNSPVTDFDAVFDGLNDTYWSYDLNSSSPGIASVTLSLPISTSYPISKVDISLLTATPASVYLRAIPVSKDVADHIKFQDSVEDYSRFSFSIPADNYSSIEITIIKSEPDRLLSSSTGMYVYSFGVRELSVSSAYYDTRATLVSVPINVPTTDNKNLAISAVALEAKHQILPGTAIQYYIAADNGIASDISSFNWLRVESASNGEVEKVVTLTSSNVASKSIDTVDSDLTFIPEDSTSLNANELNPTNLPYSDKTVYRVCALDPNENLIQPYMLANIGTFRHYGVLLEAAKIETEMYTSLDGWADKIKTDPVNVYVDYLLNQTTSISPGIFSANIGLLETKLMATSSAIASHAVTKSNPDFNLSIYLNGVLIGDLPKGVATKTIEWNFVSGINNIVIGYDKNFSGLISFSIMAGRTLSDYGTAFCDYFTYLDPIQFRNNRVLDSNTFTIDSVFGRDEILSSKKIANRCILRYYTNSSDLITAVRYRADLTRFDNPLQSPSIDSIRVKFKHNDL